MQTLRTLPDTLRLISSDVGQGTEICLYDLFFCLFVFKIVFIYLFERVRENESTSSERGRGRGRSRLPTEQET